MSFGRESDTMNQDPEQDMLPSVAESTAVHQSCCKRFWSKVYPTGFRFEFKGTMSLAWALILTQTSQIMFQPVATMFGGHLGKLELDSIALANTLINVLGDSIVIGFSTCLDTVFSQSYGIGNYKNIGTSLQRGLLLHFLLLMPCYAILLNIKPILIEMGQPADVVELVSQYLLYFMPGMFFLFMWTALKKFTQCQNIVAPHLFISLIGHAVHALLQYLMLYQFKYGILGSSIAQAITFFLLFVMTLVYTLCSKAYKLCWNGWSRQCLLDWGPLTLLGIFGILMVCLEWWAFEATVFVAGTIGATELGAQSVTFNLDSLCFGIPSGIAVASSIRVGQFLGGGKKEAALTAARMAMTIASVNALIWAIIFLAGRNVMPLIFTNVPEVIDLVSKLMPFVSAYTFFDALATIGRGVFRGCGRQKWGTVIILISYYVVALPIAIPLALLTSLGLIGTWIGMTIALVLAGSMYLGVINFGLNWETLEREALERVGGKRKRSEYKDNDEKTSLLHDSLSVSGLVTENIYVPKIIYVKRAITFIIFASLPILGLIIRLLTQDMFTTGDSTVLPSNVTM